MNKIAKSRYAGDRERQAKEREEEAQRRAEKKNQEEDAEGEETLTNDENGAGDDDTIGGVITDGAKDTMNEKAEETLGTIEPLDKNCIHCTRITCERETYAKTCKNIKLPDPSIMHVIHQFID